MVVGLCSRWEGRAARAARPPLQRQRLAPARGPRAGPAGRTARRAGRLNFAAFWAQPSIEGSANHWRWGRAANSDGKKNQLEIHIVFHSGQGCSSGIEPEREACMCRKGMGITPAGAEILGRHSQVGRTLSTHGSHRECCKGIMQRVGRNSSRRGGSQMLEGTAWWDSDSRKPRLHIANGKREWQMRRT